MEQKPRKIIYDKQEGIHDRVLNFVESILPRGVTEAYLLGSIVERKFGRYAEQFGSHEGSDIDVIVMIPKEKIPPSWKDLNTQKEWFSLYRGGKIEINETIHRVDLMVVKEGKEWYTRNRIKKKKWNVERIK